jgi:hypothetical protein
MHKFEKTNYKTFLLKFIVGFVDKGLGFPWQPSVNKIVCNFKKPNLGPQDLKIKCKTTCELLNDAPYPETTKCL